MSYANRFIACMLIFCTSIMAENNDNNEISIKFSSINNSLADTACYHVAPQNGIIYTPKEVTIVNNSTTHKTLHYDDIVKKDSIPKRDVIKNMPTGAIAVVHCLGLILSTSGACATTLLTYGIIKNTREEKDLVYRAILRYCVPTFTAFGATMLTFLGIYNALKFHRALVALMKNDVPYREIIDQMLPEKIELAPGQEAKYLVFIESGYIAQAQTPQGTVKVNVYTH